MVLPYNIDLTGFNLTYFVYIHQYPASRGLFSDAFAELTGARKRDLCPGSKQTVLSMHHGYLATEPSSYYAGSINYSGVTVNECARNSGLKSWPANNTGSMRFVSAVHDFGRRLNQSPFRPRPQVSFPRARQFSEYNGKEASASRVFDQHCHSETVFYSDYKSPSTAPYEVV